MLKWWKKGENEKNVKIMLKWWSQVKSRFTLLGGKKSHMQRQWARLIKCQNNAQMVEKGGK